MNDVKSTIKVWDLFVRIGHWTLVIALFIAYLTEDDFMSLHVWAGYVVAGVVVLRIFWGVVGTKHARFSDFVYRPSTIVNYIKGLIKKKPTHYLGHNPAGGAMVIALLISICITSYSGIALYAVEDNAGPLASIYGNQTNMTLSDSMVVINDGSDEGQDKEQHDERSVGGTGHMDNHSEYEAEKEEAEEFWEGLHEFFANFTLLLVLIHVSGVVLSSRLHKENLVKAMITGRKDIADK